MQLVVLGIIGFGIIILIVLYSLNANIAGYFGEVYAKLQAEHSMLEKQIDAISKDIEELRQEIRKHLS